MLLIYTLVKKYCDKNYLHCHVCSEFNSKYQIVRNGNENMLTT